ncbi:MAG: DUF2225 domain-containing protein [Candidatus Cloacimonetes bacterium]|nr:DUF2225 domain-containing protein [Candidatus Cloacimonadota bacterium]
MRCLVPNLILRKAREKEYAGCFDAYVLNVYMQGFSKFSATLSKQSEESIEVLTNAINKFFSSSFDSVKRRGGFISGFAVDSFTAVFPLAKGDGSINAALEIRDFFLSGGKHKTEYGDFEITASIGLSKGVIKWRIIPARERFVYWFSGEALIGSVEARRRSKPNRIVIEKDVLTNYDKKLITSTQIDQRYHIIKGSKLPDTPTDVSYRCLSQKLFIPEQISDLQTEGEFRDVLSCFINLAEPQEEHIREILDLCKKYGGYFNNIDCSEQGWVGLVLFGAPVAYEKFCTFALDFVSEVQLMYGKKIRVGLSHGRSYIGFIGSSKRAEYTAVGISVNLAHSCMKRAEWGEVWLDRSIRDEAGDSINFEVLDRIKLEGSRKPITVFKLIPGQYWLRKPHYSKKLIGRRSQLKRLVDSCEPLRQGNFAGVTYLYGEAGQGKTRLINELRKKMGKKTDFYILETDSIQRQSLNPYAYWVRKLFTTSSVGTISERRKDFRQNWADFQKKVKRLTKSKVIISELNRIESILAGLIGLEWEGSIYANLEPKYKPAIKGFALKSLIEVLCLFKPVILVIEDLHWLDKESAETLQILTRRATNIPFKIILTSRIIDDGSYPQVRLDPDVVTETIKLEGLNQTQTANLMKTILQKELTPDFRKYVYSLSQGNPFIIEQLTKYLLETNRLDVQENCYELKDQASELPNELQGVIVAHLDRLDSELKQTIQAASVLGVEFVVEVLCKMIEKMQYRSASLNDLIVKSHLYFGEKQNIWHALSEIKYIFSHAILREAVYNMQLKKQLKRLHLMAAEVMERMYTEDKTMFGEIAQHYDKAEDREKAFLYFTKAGDFEIDRYHFAPSMHYYDAALSITRAQYDKRGAETAAILSKIGSVYFARSEYDQALLYFEEALAIRRESLGNEHPDTADCLNDVGSVYHDKGVYDRALYYYEMALAIRVEVLGELHPDTASTFNDIGVLQRDRGDYEDALIYFRKAWSIRKVTLGEKHLLTAASLSNIGVVCSYKQRYDEALDCYQKALSIYSEHSEEGQLKSAIALNNICNVYCSKGDYDKAMIHIEQAVAIWMNFLGERHSQTATGVMNMGNVYYYKGDYNSALPCYEKSLSCFKEVFGERHPSVADCLCNIGSIYSSKGDLNRGLQYMEEALSIRREFLGEKYYSTADSYVNIGLNYSFMGKYDRALHCLKKGYEIYKEIAGEGHSRTATILCTMADVCIHLGKFNTALSYLEKGLSVQKEILGERHPQIAITLNLIGLSYHKKDDNNNALIYHEQALSIDEEIFGKGHLRTAGTLYYLGDAYSGKGEYDKALSLHEQVLTIKRESLEERHSSIADSYHNIGDIYLGKGDLDKALNYQENALSIYNETLGKNHIHTAYTLQSIGKIHARKGDLKRTLQYYEDALPIFDKTLGKRNQQTIEIIKNLIKTAEELGDQEKTTKYRAELEDHYS